MKMLKKLVLTFISIMTVTLASAYTAADAKGFYPEASKDAQVVCGKARFTVLTPRLIRMEWSADSVFEDRATLGIVNRNLDVPQFDVKRSKSKVTITTSDMTLVYTGQEKFDSENLSVTFRMADSNAKKGIRTVTWYIPMSYQRS